MKIRQLIKDPNYYEINREERNYTAILYTALCQPDNALKFIREACEKEIETLGPDFGIYFEYSFLRDLWFIINNDEIKKNVIRQLLPINKIDEILQKPIVEINHKFGTSGCSPNQVETPGNWAITKLSKHFSDNADFLKICKFKWSFNIKPDLVIHLDKKMAICIEAKYESNEGKYPSSSKEIKIFKERGIEAVGQIELQKYMMEELLRIKTDCVFIVYKKVNSGDYKVTTWKEVFGSLDLSNLPNYAVKMVNNLRN